MKSDGNDKVSVIIPNFNYAKYVIEAIESVIAQTYANIEIVVVDDGSTDNSVKVLSQYSRKIELVQSRNKGSCAARNLGMAHATGQYFAFLDADDIWDPMKIERQITLLKELRADLVFCGMRIFGIESRQRVASSHFSINHDWFLNNPSATPFAPSTVLLTRELASNVGGWNTSLTGPAEDFDYFRRCAKFGTIEFLNEILVSHREHYCSLTLADSRRYFEDNRRVLRIMLVEDRAKLNLLRRIKLRVKFHANFIKHFVKYNNWRLALKVLISFFQF